MSWKKIQDRGMEGIIFENVFTNTVLNLHKSAFMKIWRVGTYNLSEFKKEGKATQKNLASFKRREEAMAFAKEYMKTH